MNGKPTGRRAAREWALRALYQIDLGGKPVEEAIEEVLSVAGLSPEDGDVVRELVTGTAQAQATELDPIIQQYARGWTIDRMAVIDRNILRLALYELRHHPEQPFKVVINDAIELAKKYSTAESGRFVNGILGAIVRQMYPDEATPPPRGARPARPK
ncbi:MAG: transcription antitermination factor NusB [Fimbriimonadales bacterium]|nr:transcription antitermination factor NusB [Fimbriimonadales bacterium]MDW8051287.1 transcription antitermination factor NusB [Armatimonadota bacterium]